jgi:DNA-directed RNA polymerase specialized sigma24 family protein
VAFTPAIHKIHREICQRFPMLPSDDVAQQTWVAFLETAKSPAMLRQNGQLPVVLVMNSRKAILRWAMRERRVSIVQDGFEGFSEPLSEENFQVAVLLQDFLGQVQRSGLLSEGERELLFKLKYEGFEAKELAQATGVTSAGHRRLHRRLQTIVNRLQRKAGNRGLPKASEYASEALRNTTQPKKISSQAVNFSGEVPFSNSEKGFSPELSRPMPQVETDVAHVAA